MKIQPVPDRLLAIIPECIDRNELSGCLESLSLSTNAVCGLMESAGQIKKTDPATCCFFATFLYVTSQTLAMVDFALERHGVPLDDRLGIENDYLSLMEKVSDIADRWHCINEREDDD